MTDEKAICSVSFYDAGTGLFTGKRYSGPSKYLKQNTPKGTRPINGGHDHLSFRVDLDSGTVVDYQPPRPDNDHEWSEPHRRWRLKPEIANRLRVREAALQKISDLERRQLRPARELAVDPSNEEAAHRMREIEGKILTLRSEL